MNGKKIENFRKKRNVFGLTYGDIDIKIPTMKQVREWGKDQDLNPYGKRAPVWGGMAVNPLPIIYLF